MSGQLTTKINIPKNQVELINLIFAELEITFHNQFHKAFPDEETLTLAKQLWLAKLEKFDNEIIFKAIDKIIAGNWDIEERTCFIVSVMRNDQRRWESLCLNEMALHREPLTSMCHFEISIGRHAPVDISADGVILSTPTGSTAYSLSAGGPVITPDCPVVQLTPIAPHSLASRALVFNDSEPVTVFPATPERLVMVVDGNAGCYVWPEDRVLIRKSKHSVKFIRLEDHEFFQVLRNKLGWGLPHVAKPDK